jgi:hypothetical protein
LLYAIAKPTSPPLRLQEALSVVADERNWVPPAESGQPVAYAVFLTDSGEAQYELEDGKQRD